jgi:hypothetical protein
MRLVCGWTKLAHLLAVRQHLREMLATHYYPEQPHDHAYQAAVDGERFHACAQPDEAMHPMRV